MLERVVQVLVIERREWDIAKVRRHSRPVVGQRDLGAVVPEGPQVVAPDPTPEYELGVAAQVAALVGSLTRLPRDRTRRVEHLDSIGHLVVALRMVVVMHSHPENLTHFGDGFAV